jgi:prevent-host-death family protein
MTDKQPGFLHCVNIHVAKTHFSKLLRRAEAGEEIVICRAGQPKARLIPEPVVDTARRPGRARGLISVAPDFDEVKAKS